MSINCALCGDRGVYLKGEAAIPCFCNQKRSLQKLFKNSGLPKKMIECHLEKFSFDYYSRNSFCTETGRSFYDLAKMAKQAAKEFVESFMRNANTDGLLLTGQVGSGKTYLACSIANAILGSGRVALFVVVPDLLDQLRSTYDSDRGQDEVSEYDLLGTARQVPLLILDDLGAHNYTDWTRNKLYSIINYRLNHCLPVIITTNIALDELEEYLGERTTSRLLEMCRSYRLMVDLDIRVVRRDAMENQRLLK